MNKKKMGSHNNLVVIFVVTLTVTSAQQLSSGNYDVTNLLNGFDFLGNLAQLKDVLPILKVASVFVNQLQKNSLNYPISINCNKSFQVLSAALTNLDNWALQMIDSEGKPNSEILKGNWVWPGSFSQCTSITESRNSSIDLPIIHGQYCWVNFAINISSFASTPSFATLLALNKILTIRLGTCIPDLCSSNDATNLIKIFFDNPSIKQLVTATVECIPAEKNIWADSTAVVCLVFCILMATIIAVATAYDLLKIWDIKIREIPTKIRIQLIEFTLGIKQDTKQIIVDDQSVTTEELSRTNSIGGRILLCFSIYTNGCKLMKMTSGQETLTCLNGIRVFSMLWIILGHVYMTLIMAIPNNVVHGLEWTKTFNFLATANGMLAVDSFFVLSGLLVTYIYLREHEYRNGQISWIKFYVHRYLRLTPLYAIVLFVFSYGFSKYYGNGPFWSQNGLANNCAKYWWSNFLYINNFFPISDMCMGHTWYLANDMQFYVISPLILICFTKFIPVAFGIIGAFILTSWISIGTIVTTKNLFNPDLVIGGQADFFDYVYDKPYCRIAAYVIGMACGFLLYRTKCQLKMNKVVVFLGWLVSIGLSSSVVFGAYRSHMGLHLYSFYQAMSHTAWSIALIWMIFACCTGYGGIVNDVLSWPLWQPLGRLTYAAYLIHIIIIDSIILGLDIALPFSHTIAVSLFLSSSIISYFFAIFLSLSFEAPFLALEKLFL